MTVFANGLEISAKAQGVKAIAVFPDVCMTPPQAPPTPPGVPIPYPNFGFDSDLTSGTGTVKIGGKEISQENASKYSKCSGDEAGAAPKKGVITSKNMGKVHAQMWSMNVKAEGKGVTRFSDIATSNHGSGGNTPPMPEIGKPGMPGFLNEGDCLVGQYGAIKDTCNERGGEAHHIIPDEYYRNCTREEANAGARERRAGKTDPSRSNQSFPSVEEGCAICVGGKENGKAQVERDSGTGVLIAKKGKAYAKKMGKDPKEALGYHNGRGHGYLHLFFDASFGNKPQPVGKAVEIARIALTNCAAYNSSVIDSDCADVAKTCIEKQTENACKQKPQPTCESNVNKSNERFDNRETNYLNNEGHLNASLLPTRSSSLT